MLNIAPALRQILPVLCRAPRFQEPPRRVLHKMAQLLHPARLAQPELQCSQARRDHPAPEPPNPAPPVEGSPRVRVRNRPRETHRAQISRTRHPLPTAPTPIRDRQATRIRPTAKIRGTQIPRTTRIHQIRIQTIQVQRIQIPPIRIRLIRLPRLRIHRIPVHRTRIHRTRPHPMRTLPIPPQNRKIRRRPVLEETHLLRGAEGGNAFPMLPCPDILFSAQARSCGCGSPSFALPDAL
jgi:hypothetical protein